MTAVRLTSNRALSSLLLLAVLSALFVAAGLALSAGYRAEDHARAEVQRTRALLRELSNLNLLLLDAESAQQAYLLTTDETALRSFGTIRDALPGVLTALDAAVRMSGSEAADGAARLRALARDRMAALDAAAGAAMIAPGRTSPASITEGRQVMAALRGEIDRVRGGELARLENAFADADAQRRKVRLALGLIGATTAALAVLAAGLAFRAARDESRIAYLARITAERDRADLVSRELSHRVKNLFAVILSIISVTGRAENDPRIATQKSRLRIQALARAYELSSQDSVLGTAEIGEMFEAVVGAYAPEPDRLFLHGPRFVVPARLMTPLGLIVNELATNALKHGVWAGSEGTLSLSWAFGQHCRLHLTWAEQGGSPSAGETGDEGFGSRMIDLSLQQAAGRMTRRWDGNGLSVELSFDLDEDEMATARVPYV